MSQTQSSNPQLTGQSPNVNIKARHSNLLKKQQRGGHAPLEGSLGRGQRAWTPRSSIWPSGLPEDTLGAMGRFLTTRPAGRRPGWAGLGPGWTGFGDRLPPCRWPCPDATLRCSRTNGKVFPELPSSWALATSPWVSLQLPRPFPGPLS